MIAEIVGGVTKKIGIETGIAEIEIAIGAETEVPQEITWVTQR
jgi:hypothetical protein